jgi:hypothetical protein
MCLHSAAVLAAVKTKPTAAASGRPVLTAAARVGCGDGRSGRRDGLQIEQRDGPEDRKNDGVVTLPTRNSEEAEFLPYRYYGNEQGIPDYGFKETS